MERNVYSLFGIQFESQMENLLISFEKKANARDSYARLYFVPKENKILKLVRCLSPVCIEDKSSFYYYKAL